MPCFWNLFIIAFRGEFLPDGDPTCSPISSSALSFPSSPSYGKLREFYSFFRLLNINNLVKHFGLEIFNVGGNFFFLAVFPFLFDLPVWEFHYWPESHGLSLLEPKHEDQLRVSGGLPSQGGLGKNPGGTPLLECAGLYRRLQSKRVP